MYCDSRWSRQRGQAKRAQTGTKPIYACRRIRTNVAGFFSNKLSDRPAITCDGSSGITRGDEHGSARTYYINYTPYRSRYTNLNPKLDQKNTRKKCKRHMGTNGSYEGEFSAFGLMRQEANHAREHVRHRLRRQ